MYRVESPRVEILVLGWNWDDDVLIEFTRQARFIQEDESLFADIERAEYAAWKKNDGRR